MSECTKPSVQQELSSLIKVWLHAYKKKERDEGSAFKISSNIAFLGKCHRIALLNHLTSSGSVSPSNSTITGAFMLLTKKENDIMLWNQPKLTANC
jgi:hypothetical protein